MIRVRIATTAGRPDLEERFAADCDGSDLELVMRCLDRVELLAAIAGPGLDAIVAIGVPSYLDPQVLDDLGRHGIGLVGVAVQPNDEAWFERAGAAIVRWGAPLGEVAELCRGTGHPSIGEAPVPSGRCVAVWGPKGSPGRTTIAVELAISLAASERRTALIDLDPYGGDVAQMLELDDDHPDLLWSGRVLANEPDRAALVLASLRSLGSLGPIVIPGLDRCDSWSDVSLYAWRALLLAVTRAVDVVVLDVGPVFDLDEPFSLGSLEDRESVSRSALLGADDIVAVCRADPVGLKQFIWNVRKMREATGSRIHIVANRVWPGDEEQVSRLVESHTGIRPRGSIRDLSGAVRRAALAGRAVGEGRSGGAIRRELGALAVALGGRPKPSGTMLRLAGRA